MTKKDSFIALPTWAVDEHLHPPDWFDGKALCVFVALLAFRERYTSAKGLRGREARLSKARQPFHASYPRIAKVARVSRSTAARRCDLFKRYGILELLDRGGPGQENVYRLHEEKLYPLCASDSVTETPSSVMETLPTCPTDTISCQADTLVRSEVRSERQEENGDERRSVSPIFNQSEDKRQEPDRMAVVEEYRDFLHTTPAAQLQVRQALARRLRVSEQEAGALLNGAPHG